MTIIDNLLGPDGLHGGAGYHMLLWWITLIGLNQVLDVDLSKPVSKITLHIHNQPMPSLCKLSMVMINTPIFLLG